nr:retrovirus-related Pol polyprotein from transposon TNT 1-94 [Tanacetum cinerariifolium]
FDSVFVIGKMQASLLGKDNAICQLKKQLSELQATCRDTECIVKVRTTDSQLTKVTDPVTDLQAQNDRFRAENDKVKHHYKQLNNRDAHLDYLRHLNESVEKIRDIVEEAKAFDSEMTTLVLSWVMVIMWLVKALSLGNGVDLIKGSRETNLYTISVEDMMKSSPICLLSKASKNKSWLWHWRLNHLNFGTINDLARKDLVRGLPRLKFEKDHLCFACQLGKSKKHNHKPKAENTNLEVLNTLHMDLCGPI